jgi:hypothetical protein
MLVEDGIVHSEQVDEDDGLLCPHLIEEMRDFIERGQRHILPYSGDRLG